MSLLSLRLDQIVRDAFKSCGYDPALGAVEPSSQLHRSQFQCDGPLRGAKTHHTSPMEIANRVQAVLQSNELFSKVEAAKPGFINLTVADSELAREIDRMAISERLGCADMAPPMNVLIDFGGANVAKPLHVGHLRSAILGETLKRIGRFLGHKVIGDVHLGDWGLQMGLLIEELRNRHPNLPYFDPNFLGEYPIQSPVTVADLDELYPVASRKAKEDPTVAAAARRATMELQSGRRGYRALWRHFVDVSVADLREDYSKLGVEFDLWLGESDTLEMAQPLVDQLLREGKAVESEGAIVVDVQRDGDTREVPPLLLRKSDGAVLYGSTDIATIAQRVRDYHPDIILYVVDSRQSEHFEQVFRAARKTGIAPDALRLEHVNFGTMNGTDGKPFKTRAGGTMKLKDLIALINEAARERLEQSDINEEYNEEEKREIVRMVGLATLKFADLSNFRAKDYVFDLNRFSAFEGRTGPYLLYAAARAKAVLRKAAERSMEPGMLLAPTSEEERHLLLCLAEFPDFVASAWDKRSPNLLCDYAYRLASEFSGFYREHRIIQQEDSSLRASYLTLTRIFLSVEVAALGLLGIDVPERM
jgi:arginyl-tRNA synthetase